MPVALGGVVSAFTLADVGVPVFFGVPVALGDLVAVLIVVFWLTGVNDPALAVSTNFRNEAAFKVNCAEIGLAAGLQAERTPIRTIRIPKQNLFSFIPPDY